MLDKSKGKKGKIDVWNPKEFAIFAAESYFQIVTSESQNSANRLSDGQSVQINKKTMQLPETFTVRMKEVLGEEWDAFEQALNDESPTCIRLNPKKPIPELPEEKITWASGAYYLKRRPSFTLDPLFHAGCYYVQEASSMFLEHFVRKYFPQPAKVLDLCAAPGGKSTHLLSLLPVESLLVANETIRPRASVLSENLTKWGNSNVFVTNNDPAEIGKLNGFFDIVVADVPCSGEGMFRKDPAAVSQWSVEHVRLCAERQRRIIADNWPALKPEGILIYSTCTYNREENEENIEWICREMDAELLEEPHRFMPHKTKGEGFFIAGVRKKGGNASEKHIRPRSSEQKALFKQTHLLSSPDDFMFLTERNTAFRAIPSVHSDAYCFLKEKMKIISAGTTLGEMKGKDFIPAPALALSNALSPQAFPVWELDKETALNYLRREALQNIPSELPTGYMLVGYQNHPLGFIKNIGVRANNLYPQEWRIRMNIPGL